MLPFLSFIPYLFFSLYSLKRGLFWRCNCILVNKTLKELCNFASCWSIYVCLMYWCALVRICANHLRLNLKREKNKIQKKIKEKRKKGNFPLSLPLHPAFWLIPPSRLTSCPRVPPLCALQAPPVGVAAYCRMLSRCLADALAPSVSPFPSPT